MSLTQNQLAVIEAVRGQISAADWESMRGNDLAAAKVIVKYADQKISQQRAELVSYQASLSAINIQISATQALIATLQSGVTDSNTYLAANPQT